MSRAAERLALVLAVAAGGAVSRARAAPAAPAPDAGPAAERIAVVVGANLGAPGEEPLRFAESDAQRFRALLVELGGVRPDRALLVLGKGPAEVVRALDEARGRAAEIDRTGRRVELFVYYSGHGDEGALHLGAAELPLSRLRREIAGVPAALRLFFLDACRGAGQPRGLHHGSSFVVAAAPEGPHGTLELRASAPGEAAQESDELGGAVFTHFLVSGLRGAADVDGDHQVTLAELYAYTYRRTLLRTGAGPARQHPELAAEIAGAGEIVLSRPGAARAFLGVPRGAAWYLVFALPSAAVLGEVSGEEASELAVPSGRFLVVRRAGGASGVALADLTWGGRQTLRESDFRPIGREELVARGGHLELRPFGLEPRVGIELAPGGPLGPGLATGVAASYARGLVELGLELGLVQADVDTTGFAGRARAVSAAATIGLRSFVGDVSLALGLGPEVRYTFEHLTRHDAARAAAAGLPADEDRSGGAIGPRLSLRLGFPVGHHLTATLDAGLSVLVLRELATDGAAQLTTQPLLGCGLGLAYAL